MLKSDQIPRLRLILFRLRLAIPVILAGVGAVFLIGCFYVPFPEVKIDDRKDFRDLVGDPHSNRPIRVGVIDRTRIIDLLGRPEYQSSNGRAIGYKFDTQIGFTVVPTCFAVVQGARGAYVVKFEFDDHNILQTWQVAHGIGDLTFDVASDGGVNHALQELNRTGSALEAR